MKKLVIAFAMMVCALAFVSASGIAAETAFADNALTIASDDDDDWDDYDEPNYLTKKDMKKLDIDTSYASYNSLPLWFICDAFEESSDYYDGEYYDEKIKATVYLKKPGGKYKKVKTLTFSDSNYNNCYSDDFESYYGSDELTFYNENPGLEYDFKLTGLKPYTKYSVKVICKTTKSGLSRTITRSFRTAHKPIAKEQVSKKGNVYKWKKANGAKGYLVQLKEAVYRGKNKYGTDMYQWEYSAKLVSKTSIKLRDSCVILRVIPYTKVGKYFSLHRCDFVKTKAKLTGFFKAESKIYYF